MRDNLLDEDPEDLTLDPFDYPPYSDDQMKAYQHKVELEQRPKPDQADLDYEQHKMSVFLKVYAMQGLTGRIKK